MQASTSQPQNATEFAPSVGGTDSADANVLLVAAYMVLWLLVGGFIMLSWRRQKQINARLSRLEQPASKSG
jgi:CcmD family protein